MRKLKNILLVLLCLFLVVGCNKKEKLEKRDESKEESKFILSKLDEDNDFVYLEDYKSLKLLDGSDYSLKNIVINVDTDDVLNVNLELSSFVKKSFKDMKLDNDTLMRGNVISYVYSETNEFISVVQNYYSYIEGVVGEEKSNVYVVSKESGKTLKTSEILNYFGYSEEDFLEYLEGKLDSDDILYTIMNIKNNGYSLYIKDDSKLVIIYYEVDDEDTIRKELILED